MGARTGRRRESLAQQNGSKITRVLEDREGYADLYRTTTAGPSGQRADTKVGRVRYTYETGFEIRIILTDGPFCGETCGYAARSGDREHFGMWAMHSYLENDRPRLVGWAESLALGVDVVVNGTHAALGRHDSQRTSGGRFIPYHPKD